MDLRPGYRELPPPASRPGALACRWVRVVSPGMAPPTRVIPDACVDLIWEEDVGAHVAGPDTGPLLVPHRRGRVLVGVRFLPGAGGAALGVPLHQLRDRRVELSDLRPALARRLPGRLSAAEALARLSDVAATLVEEAPPDALAGRVAGDLAIPGATVDAVAAGVGVSPRQLRRRCHDAVGYGPKTLHRIVRLGGLLDRLAAAGPAADLARLAVEGGYADQAHLSRECVRLTGLTPAAQAAANGTRR
jgi:AraC-like DNA-binding protein